MNNGRLSLKKVVEFKPQPERRDAFRNPGPRGPLAGFGMVGMFSIHRSNATTVGVYYSKLGLALSREGFSP